MSQPILTNEDLAKIRSVEVALDGEMGGFEFLQRAQAYTEDLLDCLLGQQAINKVNQWRATK